MFFVLNNAVMDAGIVSWHSKRVYHYVRPLPAVKHLFGDTDIRAWSGPVGGVRAIKGADWWPYQEKYFVTPAFPEHVSGHSTFSAAAATASSSTSRKRSKSTPAKSDSFRIAIMTCGRAPRVPMNIWSM